MKSLIQTTHSSSVGILGCALIFILGLIPACARQPQATPAATNATGDVQVTVVFPTSTADGTGTAPELKTPPPVVIADPYALTGQCTRDECLFARMDSSGGPVGVARVQGYYSVISRTLGTGQPQPCDSFTIVTGSKALTKRYLALVNAGDTVNSKNSAGQLVINLSLGALSDTEKELLTKSNRHDYVSLLLLPHPIINTNRDVCYSPVEVLRVDPIPPTPMETYASTQLGITLRYPAAWQSGASTDYLFSGEDGFFNVTRSMNQDQTAKEACEAEQVANEKNHAYGQHPTLRLLTIDDQPACMLMPSEDQPEQARGLTLLIVQYPTQTGKPQGLLQLWADQQHIRDLGGSLQFIAQAPTSTPAATPTP
jgi:hypothetical protein